LAPEAVPGFDPDDIFGLRRALRNLPPELRDEFVARWVELSERTDCNVEAFRSEARAAARVCGHVNGGDRMSTAWSTVASAIGAYLEWRATYGPVDSTAG
jgi:hypothetical protein